MAGTSEGVIKAWLSRKRKSGGKTSAKEALKEFGRAAGEDTLQAGQSLFDLAKKWSVPLKQLLEENGITSPDQITAGMKLKIPAVKSDQQKALDAQQAKADREKRKAEREADRKKKAEERERRKKENEKRRAEKREQTLKSKAQKELDKQKKNEEKVLKALGIS